MLSRLPWKLLNGEVLFRENRSILAENINYSSCYQIHNLKDNIMKLFQQIALLLLISEILIFVWVGKPDFREGQVEKLGQNWKICHFSMEIGGNLSSFALEG